MRFERVIYEKEGGLCRITINRPEVLNALDVKTKEEMIEALRMAERDKDVRVVVISGAGERAFCTGADLRMFEKMSASEARDYVKLSKELIKTIKELRKPVIALVKGFALGGGLELVLACDLAIASEDSVLGQTELRVGLIPGAGGTQMLPKIVGTKRAKELVFTGRFLSAHEALELGLVNKVVPRERIESALEEIVEEIVNKSPLTLELAKKALNIASEVGDKLGLEYESEAFVYCFTTKDLREGIRAFLERRKPDFRGE